jgi:hypothetical protein
MQKQSQVSLINQKEAAPMPSLFISSIDMLISCGVQIEFGEFIF